MDRIFPSWYDGCNCVANRQFVSHYEIKHTIVNDSVTNLKCKTSTYTGRSP